MTADLHFTDLSLVLGPHTRAHMSRWFPFPLQFRTHVVRRYAQQPLSCHYTRPQARARSPTFQGWRCGSTPNHTFVIRLSGLKSSAPATTSWSPNLVKFRILLCSWLQTQILTLQFKLSFKILQIKILTHVLGNIIDKLHRTNTLRNINKKH